MKKSIEIALILLALGGGAHASADFSGQKSFLPDTSAFSGYEVSIPMRDGKHLAGDVYLPKHAKDKKLPIVVIMTPYGKNSMFRQAYGAVPAPDQQSENTRGTFGSGEKYTLLIVDWRGSGASKDAATKSAGTVDPIPEDGYDVIEWAAQQDWGNGKVGMWGPSALAMVQYHTATSNPPHLIAMVPSVHPAILTPEYFLPGGALNESLIRFLSGLGSNNTRGGDLRWDLYDVLTDVPALIKNYHEQVDPKLMKAPMLMIGGWYDIYPKEMLEFFRRVRAEGGEAARKHSRLIIGPWTHGTSRPTTGELTFPNALRADIAAATAYLDFWLRGDKSALDDGKPPIQYYQMGSNEWRYTDTWPPKSVVATPHFIQAKGTLSAESPAACRSPYEFAFDPSNPVPTVGGHVLASDLPHGPRDQRKDVESRSDVLVFSTPVLDKDVAVTGPLAVRAFVSTDRRDTDFSALLTDVYPDGRSMLISQGIQRMRYRKGLANEELIEPGKIYEIEIEMIPTANTFLKGHQIRLVLSSSSYPQYAVNLNDGGPLYGEAAAKKGLVATNRIYCDAAHPTAVLLPVAPN